MREILFRGKRIDNDEWVCGYYYKAKYCVTDTELCDFITIPHPDETGRKSSHYMVYPETVGQFTGLYDKNGTRIFEGDIVQDNVPLDVKLMCYVKGHRRNGRGVIKFGKHELPSDDPFEWAEAYGFYIDGEQTLVPNITRYIPCLKNYYGEFQLEVIGNIHDNPELLEG